MKRIVIFSDDWGRHPSSCQHLARHWVGSYDVVWVNTIGMRPPRLDWITARRGGEKLLQWFGPKSGSVDSELPRHEAAPKVIDAKMWPWMTHRWDRWLNRRLLSSQLTEILDGSVVVTTVPVVADLPSITAAEKWIYYRVDDFAVWPGLDGKTMAGMENDLWQHVDAVVCASESLRETAASLVQPCHLMTHGVDRLFWQGEPLGHGVAIGDRPERGDIVFWGVVDRRLDADLVLALADRLGDRSIILVGPTQNPDPRLHHHRSIRMIGPVPMDDLPGIARAASLLIMPYQDLPVTRAMQPLKFNEYLATQRPVVATRLPATDPWADAADLCETTEQFVACCLRWIDLSETAPTRLIETLAVQNEIRRERLADETWQNKADWFASHFF